MTLNSKIVHVIGNFDADRGGAQKIVCILSSNDGLSKTEHKVIYLYGNGTLAKSKKFEAIKIPSILHKIPNLFFLYKSLKKLSPDVVHLHSPIVSFLMLLLFFAFDFKIISTIHSTKYGFFNKILDVSSPLISDVVVGVTTQALNEFKSRYKFILSMRRSIKTKVIYNGVSREYLSTTLKITNKSHLTDLGLTDNCIIVGCIGRLTAAKGFDLAIESFAKVSRSDDNCVLVIIGRGEDKTKLLNLIVKYDLVGKVHLLGAVNSSLPYYREFDLCLFPSKWEGFGLTLVEAMSTGSDLLAVDIPTFREILGKDLTKEYCTPRDLLSEHLEEKVKAIRQRGRKEKNSKLIERAKLFSEENMLMYYENVYKQLHLQRG